MNGQTCCVELLSLGQLSNLEQLEGPWLETSYKKIFFVKPVIFVGIKVNTQFIPLSFVLIGMNDKAVEIEPFVVNMKGVVMVSMLAV